MRYSQFHGRVHHRDFEGHVAVRWTQASQAFRGSVHSLMSNNVTAFGNEASQLSESVRHRKIQELVTGISAGMSLFF